MNLSRHAAPTAHNADILDNLQHERTRHHSGVSLRAARTSDAVDAGRICFEAFKTIAQRHHFPPDFPTPRAAIDLIAFLISHTDVHSVVAEVDGRVAGSNFLWKGTKVAGVGPITVDPAVQNSGLGRQLMVAVIEQAQRDGIDAVRLVQAAYHNRSLSLYTKLGFAAQEPLSVLNGPSLGLRIEGRLVRAATHADFQSCNALCRRIHGHDRAGELRDALLKKSAAVVEHEGRISGYATEIGFFGHAVGETGDDLKALIAAAKDFSGPGFLVPTRDTGLLRWCLQHGLRLVQPMTLMTIGEYNEPQGAFLPSILY